MRSARPQTATLRDGAATAGGHTVGQTLDHFATRAVAAFAHAELVVDDREAHAGWQNIRKPSDLQFRAHHRVLAHIVRSRRNCWTKPLNYRAAPRGLNLALPTALHPLELANLVVCFRYHANAALRATGCDPGSRCVRMTLSRLGCKILAVFGAFDVAGDPRPPAGPGAVRRFSSCYPRANISHPVRPRIVSELRFVCSV